MIKNGSRFLNATPHSSSRSQRRGFFFLRAPFYVTFDALVPESYRALRRKSIQPREEKGISREAAETIIRGVRRNNERARYERRELAAQTHRVRDLVIEQHAGHA